MAEPTGYLAYYEYRTLSGEPLGTNLFVVDVFTVLASLANAVETAFLGNYQKTFGQIDIAADVAQMVYLATIVGSTSGTAPAGSTIKMLLVLSLAQDVIMGLEQLAGGGTSYRGGPFIDAMLRLGDAAAATLHSASPEKWAGQAAGAYGAQDLTRRRFVGQLADADRRAAAAVHRQADDVDKGRAALASIRLGLYAAIPIALLIAGCTDTWGALETYVFTVVGVAGVAAFLTVALLTSSGAYTANTLRPVVDTYRDVAIHAALVGDGGRDSESPRCGAYSGGGAATTDAAWGLAVALT